MAFNRWIFFTAFFAISINRTSGPKAPTTLPLIGASFVPFAIHEISINRRHEVIEEEINGMAILKFTWPCLDRGLIAYTGTCNVLLITSPT